MFRTKRAINLQLIKKLPKILLSIVAPVHCSCCRKPLKITSTPPYFCKTCFSSINLLKPSTCIKCKKPNDFSVDDLLCPECLTDNKFPFTEFIAPLKYDAPAKAIIHNLKFYSTPSAAETVAELIYLKLKAYKRLDKIQAFVPAPISRNRLSARSYNQTLLIAKHLSKKTGIPTITALKKIKETSPQSSLSMKERLTNLDGAIIFNTKKEIPQSVAFIDDVYTTGTTASTCCKELKKNGAKKIYVLCGCVNTYE